MHKFYFLYSYRFPLVYSFVIKSKFNESKEKELKKSNYSEEFDHKV